LRALQGIAVQTSCLHLRYAGEYRLGPLSPILNEENARIERYFRLLKFSPNDPIPPDYRFDFLLQRGGHLLSSRRSDRRRLLA
jgi:hypothetical protein